MYLVSHFVLKSVKNKNVLTGLFKKQEKLLLCVLKLVTSFSIGREIKNKNIKIHLLCVANFGHLYGMMKFSDNDTRTFQNCNRTNFKLPAGDIHDDLL